MEEDSFEHSPGCSVLGPVTTFIATEKIELND